MNSDKIDQRDWRKLIKSISWIWLVFKITAKMFRKKILFLLGKSKDQNMNNFSFVFKG